VTLWKRFEKKILQIEDSEIDFLIIKTNIKNSYFIFSKEILLQKAIISSIKKNGKLAIRLFLSEEEISTLAQKTQIWQLKYFFNFSKNMDFNIINNIFN